jgi:hypothetical protein
MYLAF